MGGPQRYEFKLFDFLGDVLQLGAPVAGFALGGPAGAALGAGAAGAFSSIGDSRRARKLMGEGLEASEDYLDFARGDYDRRAPMRNTFEDVVLHRLYDPLNPWAAAQRPSSDFGWSPEGAPAAPAGPPAPGGMGGAGAPAAPEGGGGRPMMPRPRMGGALANPAATVTSIGGRSGFFDPDEVKAYRAAMAAGGDPARPTPTPAGPMGGAGAPAPAPAAPADPSVIDPRTSLAYRRIAPRPSGASLDFLRSLYLPQPAGAV